MSILDPIIKLIGVLVWPAVVVFIILTFRRQLQELFTRISKAKYKGAEIEFKPQTPEEQKEEMIAEASQQVSLAGRAITTSKASLSIDVTHAVKTEKKPEIPKEVRDYIRNMQLANDLVLRTMASEFSIPMHRQVKYYSASLDQQMSVDALLKAGHATYLIEVKYERDLSLTTGFINPATEKSLTKQAEFIKQTQKLPIFVIAVVTPSMPDQRACQLVEKRMHEIMTKIGILCQVRFYPLNSLKEQYGIE